jgi:ABC-type bacteriocin/lantibiotic exporter with double-glycine peptidase domain
VSFSIPAGNVVAVLGANGAGKSTIARLVSGLIPITAGTVLFDGVDISGMMYDGAAADLGDVVERFLPTSPS